MFPTLSCKSAMSRDLVLPMLLLLQSLGVHNERDGHRIRCYELMHEMCQIVWREALFIPSVKALRLREAYDLYLLHYNSLCALTRSSNTYNFTTKLHFAWHLLLYGL